jgi:hypothetical protein
MPAGGCWTAAVPFMLCSPAARHACCPAGNVCDSTAPWLLPLPEEAELTRPQGHSSAIRCVLGVRGLCSFPLSDWLKLAGSRLQSRMVCKGPDGLVDPDVLACLPAGILMPVLPVVCCSTGSPECALEGHLPAVAPVSTSVGFVRLCGRRLTLNGEVARDGMRPRCRPFGASVLTSASSPSYLMTGDTSSCNRRCWTYRVHAENTVAAQRHRVRRQMHGKLPLIDDAAAPLLTPTNTLYAFPS